MHLAAPLLLLALAAPLAAQSQTIQPATSEAAVETRTFALAPGGTVKVKNVNGTVKVLAWEKDEVAFTGTFKPSSRDGHARVRVDASGTSLTFKVEQPKEGWFKTASASVGLELRVPRRVSARISTVNGSVQVEGVEGSHQLETVNGAIHARDLKGGLEMETVNGAIHGDALAGITGGLTAETVNGSVTLELGPIRGQLSARTVNGGIHFNAKGAEQVDISKRKVRATFPGSTQALSISTVNGSVTLK